jgi:putative oxidoreductase
MRQRISTINKLMYGEVRFKGIIPNLVVFLIRFYTGFTIMKAGVDKLPLPQWMTDQVADIGFPFPEVFAWGASFIEFAFGTLLIFGLMTRLSGLLLFITMSFAAFGFHQLIPLFEMHISQHFVFLFLYFMIMGGGRFSMDHWLNENARRGNKLYFIALPFLLTLIAIGFYREFKAEDLQAVQQEAGTPAINSINIAGNFNNWDPAAISMTTTDSLNYSYEMTFEESGLIQFKFTANKNWDLNLGEADQSSTGFPVSGTAELDQGNNTDNIKAYIPAPGEYLFLLNRETFEYSLDSLSTGNR